MQCNIGARGKAVRMAGGIATIVVGIVVSIMTLTQVLEPGIGWFASISMFFGGGFAIFEARKGWCIIRAMGIKTPL